MNTKVLQRSLSRVFPNKFAADIAEILLLLLLGMIAIIIHTKLKIPLHLPGKNGLLFIAMVLMGRGFSKFSFATSLSCLGASALLATGQLGFSDPFIVIVYLGLGLFMDVLFAIFSKFSNNILFLSFAGALAWMVIPLIRLVFTSFTGFPYMSFSSGILYPFITHFLFGYFGSLLGLAIVKYFSRKE